MTRYTRRLRWGVNGLAIVLAVLGVALIGMGGLVPGACGVIGGVVLWQEVQHG